MSAKPFFSVVMPTRNRANHLPFAIRSVLDQTFGDFELIVSDNFSDDDTPSVVESFDDARIKYFRSDRSLTIGDSYEFALSNAGGEYISFLSDDDAFVPRTLERVKQVIEEHNAEVVTFRLATYYGHPDIEFNRKIAANTLAIPPCTGTVTKFESGQAINLLFRHLGLNRSVPDPKLIFSYLGNAICHHSIFSRIKRVRNDIFAATPADIYLAAAVFFVTQHYHCLDESLYVWNNWEGNATASVQKGDSYREHYLKLTAGEELSFTPLKFALPSNCAINAALKARSDFDTDGKVEVDWASYYINVYDNLLFLQNMGVNLTAEMAEFHHVLASEPADLRRQVIPQIKGLRTSLKQLVRKFPPIVRFAKALIRNRSTEKRIFIEGSQSQFQNILEVAAFLDDWQTEKIGKNKLQ